jgi:hypothetical protein
MQDAGELGKRKNIGKVEGKKILGKRISEREELEYNTNKAWGGGCNREEEGQIKSKAGAEHFVEASIALLAGAQHFQEGTMHYYRLQRALS